MSRIRHAFFALMFASLFALPASAQVQTGTPRFGSFGGGPDVINLANLNSNITVPIIQKPGRGMPFAYNLIYDSSVWFPVGSSGSQSWSFPSTWGWQALGQYTGVTAHNTTGAVCTINGHNYHGITIYNNWRYFDRFGILHSFPNAQTYFYTSPCGSGTTSDQQTASDGSGYELFANGGSGYVVSSSGTTLGSTLATDRNGNEISVNSNGVFTDTLGTTVLTMSGTAPNPVTFTYTAPSGANVAYTVKYASYPIQTNFGCSGITEYGTNGTTTANLISEIDLPDVSVVPNDRYTFNYEATPGHSGFVTGRLASFTLPTGGTVSYTYSGGSSGHITCADGSAATITRTTPDGTWTYAQVKGTGAASTTTITDPQNNQTAIQFQGIYETERQTYQGLTSGTLLQTIWTCYNGSASPCNSTAVALPITQRTVIDQYGSGGQECKHNYIFNSVGGLTEQDDYDYGPGAPGALLRKTLVTFASLGNNITSFRQTVTVCNGTGSSPSCNNTGTVIAQTTYNYDETGVVAPPNQPTPQHTTVTGSRGNLTSIVYPVSGLKAIFTNYDTGQVQTSTDVNGASTTNNYGALTATCGNAFPTSVSEPLSLTRSMTWNCTGGVQLTSTDENNQTTTTAYNDPDFWRPASLTDPLSNQTVFYYQPNPTYCCPAAVASTLTFNNGNSVAEDLQYKDGFGRTYVDQRPQSPGSSTADSVSYTFDANGRPYSVSVPCAIGYAATCSTPKTTQTYDALNRPLVTTDGGGGTATNTYTQNDVLVTVGPAPTGENTKRRQLEYDALGRLTSVCELTTLSGSGTCGQTATQTGYWTKYTYDALGDLLTVTQNAQATSANQQTRTYAYDAMSRLTSETNPESGTKSYVFDSDSTMCGNGASTSKGDLVKTVDAVGNCVMRYYDALHRVTDVGDVQHCQRFRYDNTNGVLGTIPSGVSVSNKLGHLVEAETDTCASPITQSSIITDEWFSYTTRGETSDVYQSTLHSGGYYHVGQTYWANGSPSQLSGNIGLPMFSYGADGEGRPSTVSASFGQNPVTSTTYNMFTSPNQLTVALGSGDSDVFGYDPNTMRMNKYQFKIGTQTVTGTLGWNSNWSLGSLNISDPFSTANTQSCSFTADDLSRISQASCGTIWGQNFSYDPFGNIQKSAIAGTGGSSFTPTYQSSPSITNRISSVGGVSAYYDANGNSLNDTFRTATWDADSNPITIGPVSLAYDAFDRMVEQSVSGTYSEIVYGPTGVKLAIMNGTTLTKAFVPLPGGATAVYNSSGLAYYRHTDHLGSSRLASTTTGGQTPYSDTAYSPFGEPYASSGAIDNSFTGQNQDTTAGLYDFLFREYDPKQSRWTSPDPSGLASVSPANPQSWNRYVYVLNNPLALVDPSGLYCQWDDHSFDDDPANGGADQATCGAEGGTWIDGPASSDPGNAGFCYVDGVPGLCSSQTLPPDDTGDSSGFAGMDPAGFSSQIGNALLNGIVTGLEQAYCSAMPDGRTVGVSAAGSGVNLTGGGEAVYNWNTGQVSAFGYGGGVAGFNGGGSVSVNVGLIYQLGSSNSNYSGPFTTVAGSVGPFGGFGSLSGTPTSINLSSPKVAGGSVGASMFGARTGTVSVTKYSAPRNLGNFASGSASATSTDYFMYLVRRVCN
jgi:RHS repeat-associated protein